MKKNIVALLMIIMVFSLVACNNTEPSYNNNVEPTPQNDKTKEKEVTLYFANNEYVETGDENLEKLITEKRVVEYGDISIEEAIVKELIKGTENDELNSVIPSDIKLLSVTVKDDTAFVNFSEENLYGGSIQEDFTISQIVNSLLELDNIKKVQFLVDGQKAESLMGHFEITEPFEQIID